MVPKLSEIRAYQAESEGWETLATKFSEISIQCKWSPRGRYMMRGECKMPFSAKHVY